MTDERHDGPENGTEQAEVQPVVPRWQKAVNAGLLVLTLLIQVIVALARPERIRFDAWSYAFIGIATFIVVYVLLGLFAPKIYAVVNVIFDGILFLLWLLTPRARYPFPYRTRKAGSKPKRENWADPHDVWIGIGFGGLVLLLLCQITVPILFFSTWRKLVFIACSWLVFVPFMILFMFLFALRKDRARRARDKQALLEQQKREEMGRWK